MLSPTNFGLFKCLCSTPPHSATRFHILMNVFSIYDWLSLLNVPFHTSSVSHNDRFAISQEASIRLFQTKLGQVRNTVILNSNCFGFFQTQSFTLLQCHFRFMNHTQKRNICIYFWEVSLLFLICQKLLPREIISSAVVKLS